MYQGAARAAWISLFILLAGLFLWNMYQTPWWHLFLPRTGERVFIYGPLVLFVLPLLAIGCYMLRFPDRLWQGRPLPFFIYSVTLLCICALLFFMVTSRVTVFSSPERDASLPSALAAGREV